MPRTIPSSDLIAQREAALAAGAWACPHCPHGFAQYAIAFDRNICPACGYSGGDPTFEPVRPTASAAPEQIAPVVVAAVVHDEQPPVPETAIPSKAL